MSTIDDLLFEPFDHVDADSVDIYYHRKPNTSSTYYLNAVSKRAQQFFALHWPFNKNSEVYSNTNPPFNWSKHPPADFVIKEWRPGMGFPKGTWGRRPDGVEDE